MTQRMAIVALTIFLSSSFASTLLATEDSASNEERADGFDTNSRKRAATLPPGFYEENIALCDAVIVVRCEADDSAVRGALTEERHTIKRTLEELGREFKYRTPDRDFYVGVVYGPPPGLKIEFGKSAHVFDCSTRRADKDLYRWLEQVRKRVTNPPADRTP